MSTRPASLRRACPSASKSYLHPSFPASKLRSRHLDVSGRPSKRWEDSGAVQRICYRYMVADVFSTYKSRKEGSVTGKITLRAKRTYTRNRLQNLWKWSENRWELGAKLNSNRSVVISICCHWRVSSHICVPPQRIAHILKLLDILIIVRKR